MKNAGEKCVSWAHCFTKLLKVGFLELIFVHIKVWNTAYYKCNFSQKYRVIYHKLIK